MVSCINSLWCLRDVRDVRPPSAGRCLLPVCCASVQLPGQQLQLLLACNLPLSRRTHCIWVFCCCSSGTRQPPPAARLPPLSPPPAARPRPCCCVLPHLLLQQLLHPAHCRPPALLPAAPALNGPSWLLVGWQRQHSAAAAAPAATSSTCTGVLRPALASRACKCRVPGSGMPALPGSTSVYRLGVRRAATAQQAPRVADEPYAPNSAVSRSRAAAGAPHRQQASPRATRASGAAMPGRCCSSNV